VFSGKNRFCCTVPKIVEWGRGPWPGSASCFPLCVDFRSSHWNHPTMTEKWVVFMVVVFFRISHISCELKFLSQQAPIRHISRRRTNSFTVFCKIHSTKRCAASNDFGEFANLSNKNMQMTAFVTQEHKTECVTLDCELKERLDCSITPQNLIEEVRSPTISIGRVFTVFYKKQMVFFCFHRQHDKGISQIQ